MANERTTKFKAITHRRIRVTEDLHLVKKKKKNALIMIWVDFNYLYTVSWYKIHTYDAYCYETTNITQEDAHVNELGAGAI